jgi:hypothetical protein
MKIDKIEVNDLLWGAAMFRFTQTIQNLYLRIEGFISVILRNFFNSLKNFFGFFGNLLGLSKSEYFLDSNDAQTLKRKVDEVKIEKEKDTTKIPNTKRRRSNTEMDYYMKMAREIKNN